MAGFSLVARKFITVGRKPLTFRTMLFWNMVLIALVTVAVLGSLLHVSVIRAIRQGAESEQALLAREVGRRLETSLQATVDLLRVAGGNPSVLASLSRTRPEVEAAYLVNGGIVRPLFRSQPRTGPPAQVLAAAARYFKAGGRFYISAPPSGSQGEQAVWIAVPRAIGVAAELLVAEVSAPALAATLTGLSDDRRIGVYLAGENGRFFGLETPQGWPRLPGRLRELAAGAPPGNPVTTVFEDSLVTVMRAPWTGWPVVVREATDVALNPILLARLAFFVLTPLALLIAVLLSVRQAALIAGKEARRIEELAVAVVEAQEHERRRIAQDIHDWTAQRITSSYYHVQLLEKMLAKDPASVAKELPQLASTLDSANTELREIMRNLHPHLLNELGLAAAAKELVTDFARSAGLEYQVDVETGAPEPPKHVGTALFRILQEALSNVEKHAAARRIEVTLRLLPDRASLRVRDDGTGFALGDGPAERHRAGGFGVAGMRERAELLGGTFSLTTTPGQGTTVEVSIPWNMEPNRLSAS